MYWVALTCSYITHTCTVNAQIFAFNWHKIPRPLARKKSSFYSLPTFRRIMSFLQIYPLFIFKRFLSCLKHFASCYQHVFFGWITFFIFVTSDFCVRGTRSGRLPYLVTKCCFKKLYQICYPNAFEWFSSQTILIHDQSTWDLAMVEGWHNTSLACRVFRRANNKRSPSIHHLRDRGDIVVTNPLIIFQVIRDLLTKRKPLLVSDHTAFILNASWECDNFLCSTTFSPKMTSKFSIRISLQLMIFFLRELLNLRTKR